MCAFSRRSLREERKHRRACLRSSLFMKLLIDEIGCLLFAQKITPCLLLHQPGSLQLKVSARDLAFINRESLRQRGWRRENVARGNLLVFDVRFDLFAHLRVDWAFHGALADLYF